MSARLPHRARACRCCAMAWPIGAISLFRTTPRPFPTADRAAEDLRRPGGDRDRERAAVQRDQGGARAADRDSRDAAGHQQLADRRAAGVRRDRRARDRCAAAHRRRARLRRRATASGGLHGGTAERRSTRFARASRASRAARHRSARAVLAGAPVHVADVLEDRRDYALEGRGAASPASAAAGRADAARRPVVGAIGVAARVRACSPTSRSRCCRPSPTRR